MRFSERTLAATSDAASEPEQTHLKVEKKPWLLRRNVSLGWTTSKMLSHWMQPRCRLWFGTKGCSLYVLHVVCFYAPDLIGLLFTAQDTGEFIESIETLGLFQMVADCSATHWKAIAVGDWSFGDDDANKRGVISHRQEQPTPFNPPTQSGLLVTKQKPSPAFHFLILCLHSAPPFLFVLFLHPRCLHCLISLCLLRARVLTTCLHCAPCCFVFWPPWPQVLRTAVSQQ